MKKKLFNYLKIIIQIMCVFTWIKKFVIYTSLLLDKVELEPLCVFTWIKEFVTYPGLLLDKGRT